MENSPPFFNIKIHLHSGSIFQAAMLEDQRCGWRVGGSATCVEVPTVARDIIYGWARGLVGGFFQDLFAPEEFTHKAQPERWGDFFFVFCCDGTALLRCFEAIFTHCPKACHKIWGWQNSAWISLPEFRSMIFHDLSQNLRNNFYHINDIHIHVQAMVFGLTIWASCSLSCPVWGSGVDRQACCAFLGVCKLMQNVKKR